MNKFERFEKFITGKVGFALFIIIVFYLPALAEQFL